LRIRAWQVPWQSDYARFVPSPPRLSELLLRWYARAKRDLPWRRTRDPYRILLSEIMLQQTRVTTVVPFYDRFLRRFPDAAALAGAPEREVLALWSGLGYYSRARNLQAAARQVVARGRFPDTYDEIRALPGVGLYTAAALGSLCFDVPRVVVDGNVIRVMSRLKAERGDVGLAATRARLEAAAQELLPRSKPGEFNQALMELGATVCAPKHPKCLLCPWREHCGARQEGIEEELPVRRKQGEPRRVDAVLLLIEKGGKVLVWQRGPEEQRMAGFWELPDAGMLPNATVGAIVARFQHTITRSRFVVEVKCAQLAKAPRGFHWKTRAELSSEPVSTMARKALRRTAAVSSSFE
jgi:A/G-specific adenine glycosylase